MPSASTPSPALHRTASTVLNKVPEVTIWFWVIKILCTTVGESFADWVSVDLGVGLVNTAVIFTVVLAAVLTWQIRLPRYHAFSYWLTVVTLSVTGTLYTDILTDRYHVSLALTTPVFAALLAIVFGVWFRRERTLSIHSITSVPREAFYWLAILVTFALGTAVGDWTLELTGWTPGVSVMLPALLIIAVVVGWRLRANPVLSFWLAYVLTRPLGANLGDWMVLSKPEGGLGVGTAVTSVIFLCLIGATVTYLAVKRPDVIESGPTGAATTDATDRRGRETVMLGYYAMVTAIAVVVLVVAHGRPHRVVSAEEDGGATVVTEQLSPQAATVHFPAADVTQFRSLADRIAQAVDAGDQATAGTRATDLETAWDEAQTRLEPLDEVAWTFLDAEIDDVLSSVRAATPDSTAETAAVDALVTSLTP